MNRPTGRTHLSLLTLDAHAAHRAITQTGAPASGPPTVMTEAGFWNGCVVFYARDPDGHTIEFIKRPTGSGDR